MPSDIDIKEHILALLDERQRYFNLYVETQKTALELNREITDKELSKLNELRQEVVKDRSQFLLRDTFYQELKSLDIRFKPLEESRIKLLAIFGAISFLSGILGSLVTLFIKR